MPLRNLCKELAHPSRTRIRECISRRLYQQNQVSPEVLANEHRVFNLDGKNLEVHSCKTQKDIPVSLYLYSQRGRHEGLYSQYAATLRLDSCRYYANTWVVFALQELLKNYVNHETACYGKHNVFKTFFCFITQLKKEFDIFLCQRRPDSCIFNCYNEKWWRKCRSEQRSGSWWNQCIDQKVEKLIKF